MSDPVTTFPIRLDAGAVWHGNTVVGGYPFRLMKLNAAGRSVVERLADGVEPWSDESRGLAARLVAAGLAHPVVPSRPLTDGEVAVVVPVRDDPDGLERLLASDGVAGLDVVVVDDGSNEANAVRIAAIADAHGAVIDRIPESSGPAAARNRGAALTDAPLVAFVDADCVPERGWLAALVAHFDDPVVVAAAPRVAGSNAGTGSIFDRFEADRGPLDRGANAAKVGPGPVPFVPSAALVVRRAAFEAESGFDESMRVGEDVDFVWRLIEGGIVRFEPTVHVTHRARKDIKSWLKQRFGYGQSAAALDHRHPGKLRAAELNIWTAAAFGLALFAPDRLKVAAPVAAAGSVVVLRNKLQGHLPEPERVAARLVAKGTAHAAKRLVDISAREWAVPVAAAALVSKKARGAFLVGWLIRPLVKNLVNPTRAGRLNSAALDLADGLAYGAGVTAGCIEHRRPGPLAIRITR